DQLVQVSGNSPNILRDAPFVVVENPNKAVGGLRDIVQRFKGNPIGQGGIAENRDNIFIRPTLIASGADAQSRRQSRAGVRRAVTVMLALAAQREAAQAAGAANSVEPAFASGQQLVDVNLVADIPHKFVFRRAEDVVQRDG